MVVVIGAGAGAGTDDNTDAGIFWKFGIEM